MQTKSTANRIEFQPPPQAIEAEQAFLSACMIGGAKDAVGLIQPDDFYRTAHQTIFTAILALYQAGQHVDLVTVTSHLRSRQQLEQVGGASYISKLMDTVPAAVDLEGCATIICEASMRRKMIARANELARMSYSADVSQLMASARQVVDIQPPKKQIVFTSYEQLSQTEPDRWEQIGKRGAGIPTGYTKLDTLLGGFQDTDLIVLAARPAMGKSALMINIAENIAASDHPKAGPVAVFSLEMSKSQLYMRQTARVARVDSQRFRLGGIQPDEWRRIVDAQEYLHKLPVFIDDSPALHLHEIERRSRVAVQKFGARVIIIDHLQKIKGPPAQRKDLEVGEITSAIKALAKELDIPIILLCQLNRTCESRDDKRPRLSDLRESGAIEQDADVVMFLYRDEYYNKDENNPDRGIAEINVAKQRNGQTGPLRLTWIPWRQSFENHMPQGA